jgi:transposase
MQEVIPVNRSKAYSSIDVNRVDADLVVKGREAAKGVGDGAEVGIDVGKFDLRAVLRWRDGSFERPWKVANPAGLAALVSLLKRLSERMPLRVALEPSGTYGDSLRQALSDAGLAVERIGPTASHDYAEVFDGVPSQHDGKDAAVVAELCAMNKGKAWPWRVPEEAGQEIAYWVDRLDCRRRELQVWTGKLEGLLGRHWPESAGLLKASGATMLRTLTEYGGPRELAADPQAAATLKRFGGHYLNAAKVDALLAGAKATMGVRQTIWDRRRMQDYARSARSARRGMREARRRLHRLTRDHASIRAMEAAVGLGAACVLWVSAGDPGDYSCAAAYAKALGLNLAERSSGIHKGKLRISKRGRSAGRRWLYFAALRWVKDPAVAPWYQAKKARDGREGGAGRALVGVMRKLAGAVYQVAANGVAFEARRLFPGSAPAGAAASCVRT